MLCLCCAFWVKRAVTVVNPLMGSGATPTSRSPQWAFMVGGYPVGSWTTLTWLNARVPARSSRMHCLESSIMGTRMHFLEGRSEISWHKRSGVLKGWISWVWCHVLKQGATCTTHRVHNCIFEGWCFISCHILVSCTEMGWFGRVGGKVGRLQVISNHFGTVLWWWWWLVSRHSDGCCVGCASSAWRRWKWFLWHSDPSCTGCTGSIWRTGKWLLWHMSWALFGG